MAADLIRAGCEYCRRPAVGFIKDRGDDGSVVLIPICKECADLIADVHTVMDEFS